jgi:hypothetical protein
MAKVIYLTNACGEDTGYGSIDLQEADFAKVTFEDGPGYVLPYIAEISGIPYVLGNLEIAYKDDFWLDDKERFDTEESVRSYCEAACEYITPRLTDGMKLLPLDESSPGRIIIGVAVPMATLTNADDTTNALSLAFGEMANLPENVPPPTSPSP